MEGVTLKQMAEWLESPWSGSAALGRKKIRLCTDSREFKRGQVFWALKGPSFDGHAYVEECLAKGGLAAVVNKDWLAQNGKPVNVYVPVGDTGPALLKLAQRYAAGFALPKVAVTGSNGKTTTKDMIAAILRQAGPTLATEGNFNNHIGVPLTLFGLKKSHRYAVLELGMSHPGEIAPLAEAVAPRIAVVTNVGYAHLEAFGTREAIGEEKLSIQKGLVPGGTLILNLDDPILAKARAPRGGRLVTFGVERGQIRAADLTVDGQGCASFRVGRTRFRIPVPGRHNVYNALAAIAVGLQLRIPKGAMARALAGFVPSKYRMQLRKLGEVTVVEDCYNANPTSVRSALSSLADFKAKGRRIAVLGDMLELGPESAALHEETGRYAAEMGLDLVATFGSESRHLNRGAREKGMARTHAPHFLDFDLLAEEVARTLRPGDVLLVKGSRGMRLERLCERLKQQYRLGVLQAGGAR